MRIMQMRNEKSKKGLQSMIDSLDIKDAVMVEIGCYTGESTIQFSQSSKIKTIYAVDPYSQQVDEVSSIYNPKKYAPMSTIENIFIERTSNNEKIIKVKMTGQQFSQEFPLSVDFVYIDGIHTFEGVCLDIDCWIQKIKPNGYLCGHDFGEKRFLPVKKAVLNRVLHYGYDIGNIQTFSDTSWKLKIRK